MIPYRDIDTIFLDAGNTLVSIDFDWIARELEEEGVRCDAETLRRAEAAGRPTVSRLQGAIATGDRETAFTFAIYLGVVFSELGKRGVVFPGRPEAMAERLAPRLKRPGETQRLWSWVLPGVASALAGLRAAGLRLLVVSNSDGSVEEGLRDQGLLGFLDAVVDSHAVGFEKPDRRIFDHALALSKARAERTLHVGDLYSADVLGARSAGIHPLLLDPFDDWRDEADCARLPDLTALLRGFEANR